MHEVTLVITYRTDAYEQEKVEDHYPTECDTPDKAVEYDIAAFTEGEAMIEELIDVEGIVSVRSLGAKECK